MRRAGEISCGNPDAYFGTVILDPETGEVVAEVLNDAEKHIIHHDAVDDVVRLVETRPDVESTEKGRT